MFPNEETWSRDSHSFKYPANGLLQVKGIIPDSEMHHPSPAVLDEHGSPCLMVMKPGNTTGLTLGRSNTIRSFVRTYGINGGTKISKEWAIFSYNSKLGPFSAGGDSGSGIFDCWGRLGGLLTGGSGTTDSTDVTYATPISFILDSLHEHGYEVTLDANLK